MARNVLVEGSVIARLLCQFENNMFKLLMRTKDCNSDDCLNYFLFKNIYFIFKINIYLKKYKKIYFKLKKSKLKKTCLHNVEERQKGAFCLRHVDLCGVM